jgi:tripartite-type tricarboxylate transporter receptor subunit TctC
MKLPRRTLLRFAASAPVLPALSRIALALDYPTRPVHLISGYAAGGVVDIIARLIGSQLSERLGQTFVIEDRPGAGSNLATESVVRAAPDGYTLLLSSSSNSWNATLYEKLNFDFIRDTTPVATITHSFNVMEVSFLRFQRKPFRNSSLTRKQTPEKSIWLRLARVAHHIFTANCSKPWLGLI